MIKYKDNIGINKYNFGTEIEFSDINIGLLYKNFKKENCNVKFVLDHKLKGFDFNKYWCLDRDATVTYTYYDDNQFGKSYYGGEISSKILNDNPSSWMELKNICTTLKNNNASINSNCSNHIHVDISNIDNYNNFYEIFSKILALYENDFILFYMGERYFVRDTFLEYSRPLKRDLLRKVLNIDFSGFEYLKQLIYEDKYIFGINDGVHINPVYNELEIRYPNGTLDEKIIQNSINFTLRLIDSINNDKFDKNEINYLLRRANKNIFNYDIFSSINYNGFYKIIKTITNDSCLENDFMSQYEKVLSTK